MSRAIEVVALVEGPTERIFVQDILGPYLARTEVYITPIILTKPGRRVAMFVFHEPETTLNAISSKETKPG